MATAVETLDKLERRLTISFPIADVQSEVEKRLKVHAQQKHLASVQAKCL
jgi:trigger factor